jgi:hypothetical protein
MAQFSFGSGNIYYVPVTATNNIAPPSGIGGGGGGAINFATLAWRNIIRLAQVQAFSVDIDLPTKALQASGVFPIAVARGRGKVALKIDNARVNAAAFNAILFGDDQNNLTTPAGHLVAEAEAGTIPPSPGPYTITVANAAAYNRDLGVYVQATNGRFARGATATASGVYSMVAGVYTFNAADAGTPVYFDYEYTSAAVPPYLITIRQQIKGATPTFLLVGFGVYQGKQLYIQLNTCVIDTFSLNFKLDDFAIPSLSGMAIASPTDGSIGSISSAEL